MQVTNLKAVTNPSGGRIDLSWTNPVSDGLKSIKVLRRESAFPEGDADPKATKIHENPAPVSGVDEGCSDTGVKGETVYYYSVIAYDNASNYFPAFISAAASNVYDSAAYMYKLLPALYRNYDEIGTGQLKRFFEMLGPQVDLFRSFARGMRDLSDTDRIDGALLDLLAKWIGWNSDLNLGFDKQRNEIKYAPHYYRTTGITANVRATINRLATWDTKIKEFVHNVFLSNNPERLTILEWERHGGEWKAGDFVNLEVMHEGRPSVVKGADGRTWFFYHAISGKDCDFSGSTVDVWCKTFDFGEWLPAKRISLDGDINRHPTALERQDGSMLLFWNCYEGTAERKSPKIKSCLLSRGRQPWPARIQSTLSGPFDLDDGDRFTISVDGGADRTVTFREEQFGDISNATAEEIADLLDWEIPGVIVDLSKDRKIRITSNLAGAGSGLKITNGAAKIGFTSDTGSGIDSTKAQITGALKEPFSLNGKCLVIRIDRDREAEIVFKDEQTAAQVAETVNKVKNIASDENGYLRLSSLSEGGESFVSVDLDASSAASELGFGAPLPWLPEADDAEPTVLEDENGKVWLFWSSRRTGTWKIWYNCFDGTAWGSAKQLTTGSRSDRRPEAAFNSNDGRIWVFWSRKKENGLWNIFYRTTTKLAFAGIIDADWVEEELDPAPADYSNDDPSAVPLESGEVELFYSSNRTDGWNIWSKTVDAGSQGADSQITMGQFTYRSPIALKTGKQDFHLFFCTNEYRSYTSGLYPLSETTDFRYAGSTALDTGNTARISFRREFYDILSYTHDTLKGESDWFARDTLGVFLKPDTQNEQFTFLKASRILKVLKQFLPVQVRPVIILSPPVCAETVYTYDFPDADPQCLIGETEKDSMISDTDEAYSGPDAESEDTLPDWIWLHSWSEQYPDQITVNFTKSPVDTRYRTWHTGLKRGG